MKEKNRQFKRLRKGIAACIIMVALAMIAPATLCAGDKVYKGRLSYHWGPKHFSAIMAEKFAKECRTATNGRLDLQVFPQGQLFSIAQIVPALAQGSVDMGGVLGVLFMRVDKNFYLVGMANLFDSFQQMRDFWETDPVGKKYWTAVQKKLGIKILAYIPVGPACYFTTKHQLDSLASFKGLKARTLIGTERFSFKPLGVSYVKVSTAEVYTALKSGMINTLMTVPSAMKGRSWWDFLRYAQKPYQLYADAYIAVNLKWWNSLPADIKEIVEKEVGPRISAEATNGVMSFSENVLKEFIAEHHGTVSTLSDAEFGRLLKLYQTTIYPNIAKNIDPELYAAALRFVGKQ